MNNPLISKPSCFRIVSKSISGDYKTTRSIILTGRESLGSSWKWEDLGHVPDTILTKGVSCLGMDCGA